ncbi:hypothetical protein HOLleu_06493 [Holothuria leucospilota]|uniref:Uncharacterized protein n=1 Tax=Holothuria leucospilota TaxID=206669 RepID=A0A9Q1CMJ5_HOLLE|nr:hypothetical protein HOLleu_06493 [Holothuria leucospilota]
MAAKAVKYKKDFSERTLSPQPSAPRHRRSRLKTSPATTFQDSAANKNYFPGGTLTADALDNVHVKTTHKRFH